MLKAALVSMVVGVTMGVVMGAAIPETPIYGPPTYQTPVARAIQDYKEEPPKPYAFDYGVQDAYTGANFGHSENSDGQAVTGSYKVALPDGRIQTVSYVADHHNGFQAKVEYEGQAVYPENQPAPAYSPQPASPPVYSQPSPPVYSQSSPPVYPAPPTYN